MEDLLLNGNCIETFTGEQIDVFNMRPEQVNITDIAHALSGQSRFNSHLPYTYTVAEHVLNGLPFIPEDYRLEWLLHDASEAYLPDMPRPIKVRLPEFKALEVNVESVISERFKLKDWNNNAIIKDVDNMLLQAEHDFFRRSIKSEVIKYHFLNSTGYILHTELKYRQYISRELYNLLKIEIELRGV